jgi:hypothetical protein
MAFGNFTLASAVADFGLTVRSQSLFHDVADVDVGTGLRYYIETFGQLAVGINTEKARSEWLIAPVFGEVWNRGRGTLFVLSGVDFTVDREAGLSGIVDFMVGRGPQLSFVLSPSCPILAVVEAKNESIPGGQGQCVAEMIASLRFNQQAKTDIQTVYGVVTNGVTWKFHRLNGTELTIDTREYLISESDKILGILMYIVGLNPIPVSGG